MSYCTQAYLEQQWGSVAVNKWADLDNDADAVKIAARITEALAWATDEIDDHLRGGPCVIPFYEPYPRQIQSICARLAGAWLYQARGAQDSDPDGEQQDKLSATRNDCYARLRKIHAGIIRLDVVSRVSVPQVIDIETTADETETYVDETNSWQAT